MRDRKPILCLDFDGVIHSYTSGWQGADVVSDPPVDGAIPFMYIAQTYFTVAVFSSRSRQAGGIEAMRRWLKRHAKQHEDAHLMPADWVDEIEWPAEKPPAFVTLDDRAITFTGVWPDVDELRAFKPWNKRETANVASR